MRSDRRSSSKSSPSSPPPRRIPWLWICLGVAAVGVLTVALLPDPGRPTTRIKLPAGSRGTSGEETAASGGANRSNSSDRPAKRGSEPTDWKPLIGRWQRPDGGYVLKIKTIADDGRADATYLNPNPIHVHEASAERDGATLKLFVELRDVNYPGSTYKLTWDQDNDQLVGQYFQAALGETHEVQFVRAD